MRAMVVERYGAPLVLHEIPVPIPGPGEVLVRVIGCGVCRTDLKIASGLMPFSSTLALPHVPGHEISGEIAGRGRAARGREGDRVIVFNYWSCGRCTRCLEGDETLCERLRGWVGFTSPGGFQEYLAVPDDCVLPLPDIVRPQEGGPLSCALGTAYHAVVSRGAVRAGETVAVLGAGGVGLHAVQVARAAGAATFALDVKGHRLAAARAAGADAAFGAGGDAVTEVRRAAGGSGVDLAVDTVGHHDSLLVAARLVRPGGRIVLVGYTGRADEYPPVPTDQVVLDQITLIGCRYVTRPELRRALDLVRRGLVRPVISGEVPLEQANEALALVRDDRATGRVVVRVGDPGSARG